MAPSTFEATTMTDDVTTRQLQGFIERLKAGDDTARWELLERAFGRLRGLASTILGDFPRVKDEGVWRTTDVASEVRVRLAKALQSVEVTDVHHFFCLAALKVRQLLLDLVRRLPRNKPESQAAAPRPDYQDVVARLLELLPSLPEDQYAVLDLEFSLGFETGEIAAALGVDESTVRKRRRRAYDAIARALDETFPGLGKGLAES
jgi:RNA polymerase sigma factor (sigma-70 family)